MSPEAIFTILNLSVVPAWALLVFLPRADVTRTVVHSGVYPLLLGLFYISFFAYALLAGTIGEGIDFTSVAGVSIVFQAPIGVLIGWSHYLVFDLFVGAWVARDSQRRGVPHLAAVPCLLLTLVVGPVGLLCYLLVRLGLGKGGLALGEDAGPA